jgi:hypothetical protein
LENWNGNTNDAAFVAFREMGTNAIPALLNVIQSGGPPLQKMILKLNREQSVVDLGCRQGHFSGRLVTVAGLVKDRLDPRPFRTRSIGFIHPFASGLH